MLKAFISTIHPPKITFHPQLQDWGFFDSIMISEGVISMTNANEKSTKKEKPKYNTLQNSGFMIKLAKKHSKHVQVFCVLMAIFEVASNLLGLFVAPMILAAIEAGQPLDEFIRLVLMFIIPLIILKMAHKYCDFSGWMGKVKIRSATRDLINEKFMTTSYSNTLKEDVKKKTAEAMRSCSNNDTATEAIWATFYNILKNIIGFAIYMILLTALNPLIIGFVLITTMTGYFINKKINTWEFRHRDEKAKYSNQLGYLAKRGSNLELAKDIRLFGMANWLEDVYQAGFHLYTGFITKREKTYIWADFIDLALTFLRNGLAYFYLINLVLNNSLSAANFLLYFTAIGGFTTWITGILSELTTLHQQSLDLSRIREVLDYPEEFLFEDGEPLILNEHGKYELELRNVSFRYEGAKRNTLENINLKIKAGEKLAIVGVNGAGKTTLIKLLCGFLDPTEGEVLLNGVNIKKYHRQHYYQLFSAVFQDFAIMAASIATNIAQSFSAVDANKVFECAKKADIFDKINSFPEGFDSKLDKQVYEDAVDLSGGQMQRLMLARALYKNAPILVLDEPTAALDPIAENEIYQKYNELTEGKTAIYISHRLASTGFCDRIILIDGNMIAESGTHDELVALGKEYANMFEIQGKYYQEDVKLDGEGQ